MTTKTKTSVKADSADSNYNETVANEAKNVRREPTSLRVRSAVKAGLNFTKITWQ